MKLHIDGNINAYYVQTLVMIFFPGEKFSEDDNDEHQLFLRLTEDEYVTLKKYINNDCSIQNCQLF